MQLARCCCIRISKILLYAIHNWGVGLAHRQCVVLSGFKRYFCMQYTTRRLQPWHESPLFYQDFKDTFVCNTQRTKPCYYDTLRCFIMISKILLGAIHNLVRVLAKRLHVVLSWFQRYFCMQYTTLFKKMTPAAKLFYLDFKDTFVCNTQPSWRLANSARVVLSGFQRYFWMQYTTSSSRSFHVERLFYQDVNEQFCCKSTEKIGNMQIYEKYFVI